MDGVIPANTAEVVLSQVDQDIAAGQIRVVTMDNQTEAEFNAIMARCYRHAPPIPLRTFDAIHLATARAAGETEIVATDKRLRDAAKVLGFTVFPA
jgi:predicted nucleic acid-binding protein